MPRAGTIGLAKMRLSHHTVAHPCIPTIKAAAPNCGACISFSKGYLWPRAGTNLADFA